MVDDAEESKTREGQVHQRTAASGHSETALETLSAHTPNALSGDNLNASAAPASV